MEKKENKIHKMHDATGSSYYSVFEIEVNIDGKSSWNFTTVDMSRFYRNEMKKERKARNAENERTKNERTNEVKRNIIETKRKSASSIRICRCGRICRLWCGRCLRLTFLHFHIPHFFFVPVVIRRVLMRIAYMRICKFELMTSKAKNYVYDCMLSHEIISASPSWSSSLDYAKLKSNVVHQGALPPSVTHTLTSVNAHK